MHELTHLTNDALASATAQLVAEDCRTTAALLAHLAENDARQLYLELGFPSLFAYCVESLHYSESAAYRRIHAARAARRFPRLLALVSEGRLHLAAICLLAPHLADENFDELVAAATHRSKVQVERWLAVRFAPPLLLAAVDPSKLVPLLAAPVDAQLVPRRVEAESLAVAPPPPPAVVPHVLLRIALPESTNHKLQRARALLGHAVPAGDMAQVLDRVLDVFIAHAEKQKFAATRQPRKARPARPAMAAKPSPRRIPAHVKRAAWQRNQGCCSFVSARGRRCGSEVRLEFDHIEPIARGGVSDAGNVRLLCRAHNQFEAERVLGREFMKRAVRARRDSQATRPGMSSRGSGMPGSRTLGGG